MGSARFAERKDQRRDAAPKRMNTKQNVNAASRSLHRMVSVLFVSLVVWLAISCIIFRFRHPWATETETLLNVHNALLLKKVPYDQMRPREAR